MAPAGEQNAPGCAVRRGAAVRSGVEGLGSAVGLAFGSPIGLGPGPRTCSARAALPVLHQQPGLELLGGRLFGEPRALRDCRL